MAERSDFGIDPAIHDEWRDELRCIELPDDSALFAHICCPNPAAWMAKVILDELSSINIDTSRDQGVKNRSLIYALPDEVSVETARLTLAAGGSDPGFRIATYNDIVKATRTNPLPSFLRSAIVVFDTNFGRVSPQLLAASTGLFRVWIGLAARGEAFDGTAIAISPTQENIWPNHATSICLKLEHGPHIDPQYLALSGSSLADSVAGVIRCLAKRNPTIVCTAPVSLALAIQAELNKGDPFTASIWTLTPGTLTGQWPALSAQDRESSPVQVLLVDPSLRFLPHIPGPCVYLLPTRWSGAGVDPEIHQVVDLDHDCGEGDVQLAISLGEGARRINSNAVVVSNTPSPKLTPSVRGSWPAWQQNMAESLLILVAQLDDNHPTLADLVGSFPMGSPWAAEVFRRLQVMKLIKVHDKHSAPSLDRRLVLCDARACLAAFYLTTGLTRSLGESLLIAEAVNASSVAVKMTLAAVATACHSDMSVTIARGDAAQAPPTLEACRAACAGPGAQMCRKGNLWVAIGALAHSGMLNSDNTQPAANNDRLAVVPVPGVADQFRNRFRQVVRQISGAHASTPYRFPDSLTEEEVLLVESAIVRAWLPNVTYTFPSIDSGRLSCAIEVLTGQDVSFVPYRWGVGLDIAPYGEFAVHFGLTRDGDRYTSDTLTLVSTTAFMGVMEELFPSPASAGLVDYTPLLRGG